jgi:hypothetical protein
MALLPKSRIRRPSRLLYATPDFGRRNGFDHRSLAHLVLTGHPALDAVAWVRSSYCTKAVETPGQEAFIAVPLTWD